MVDTLQVAGALVRSSVQGEAVPLEGLQGLWVLRDAGSGTKIHLYTLPVSFQHLLVHHSHQLRTAMVPTICANPTDNVEMS